MTRSQINWVLVPDSPILASEKELAQRYPEPTPATPETLAALKLEAEGSPPSEQAIARYACALVESGNFAEACAYCETLVRLVPGCKVAEAIRVYANECSAGGDSSVQLRIRVAHAKRFYRAVHEDLLARMTSEQREAEPLLRAGRGHTTARRTGEANSC